MTHFSRLDDHYSCNLSEDEASILTNLVEQLLELLGEGDFFHHFDNSDPLAQLFALPPAIQAPEDPVLLRLLPHAYDDEEEALEFRRFTEGSLRSHKQRNLKLMREELLLIVDHHKENIPSLDPFAWMAALNDIRLALGVRLEINEESFERFESLSEDDPQKSLYAVYFWLGGVQESLINLIE
jgi:hypothetical protein